MKKGLLVYLKLNPDTTSRLMDCPRSLSQLMAKLGAYSTIMLHYFHYAVTTSQTAFPIAPAKIIKISWGGLSALDYPETQ